MELTQSCTNCVERGVQQFIAILLSILALKYLLITHAAYAMLPTKLCKKINVDLFDYQCSQWQYFIC